MFNFSIKLEVLHLFVCYTRYHLWKYNHTNFKGSLNETNLCLSLMIKNYHDKTDVISFKYYWSIKKNTLFKGVQWNECIMQYFFFFLKHPQINFEHPYPNKLNPLNPGKKNAQIITKN